MLCFGFKGRVRGQKYSWGFKRGLGLGFSDGGSERLGCRRGYGKG